MTYTASLRSRELFLIAPIPPLSTSYSANTLPTSLPISTIMQIALPNLIIAFSVTLFPTLALSIPTLSHSHINIAKGIIMPRSISDSCFWMGGPNHCSSDQQVCPSGYHFGGNFECAPDAPEDCCGAISRAAWCCQM